MMKLSIPVLCFLFSIAGLTQAETGTHSYLPPGLYGSGNYELGIAPLKDGKQSFQIFIIGTNGHHCDLSGHILNGRAKIIENENDRNSRSCELSFTLAKDEKTDVIDVRFASGDEGLCTRGYCGMRVQGWYLTSYPKKPEQCASYLEMPLAEDRAPIPSKTVDSALLEACASYWDWNTEAKKRLQAAQNHLARGDGKACRATLAAYRPHVGAYAEDISRSGMKKDVNGHYVTEESIAEDVLCFRRHELDEKQAERLKDLPDPPVYMNPSECASWRDIIRKAGEILSRCGEKLPNIYRVRDGRYRGTEESRGKRPELLVEPEKAGKQTFELHSFANPKGEACRIEGRIENGQGKAWLAGTDESQFHDIHFLWINQALLRITVSERRHDPTGCIVSVPESFRAN
jgi:hypothetical protein